MPNDVTRDGSWRLLDFEYACDQSPQVQAEFEGAQIGAEYGVNWYEFIHTREGLGSRIQTWWDALPAEERRELLASRLEDVERTRDSLYVALAALPPVEEASGEVSH